MVTSDERTELREFLGRAPLSDNWAWWTQRVLRLLDALDTAEKERDEARAELAKYRRVRMQYDAASDTFKPVGDPVSEVERLREALRVCVSELRNFERTDTGHPETGVLNALDEAAQALSIGETGPTTSELLVPTSFSSSGDKP